VSVACNNLHIGYMSRVVTFANGLSRCGSAKPVMTKLYKLLNTSYIEPKTKSRVFAKQLA